MVYDGTSFGFPSVLPAFPPVVYLWYSNYTEGSHRGVRCLSIVTRVAANNSPLRDRARTHVGVQGHLNIGDHGPRRDRIIASAALTIDKSRIFPTAQTRKPTPFVPSIWAPTHTTSTHAKHPGLGMADTPHHPGDTEETYACERTTLPFAWTGKGFEDAPAPSTTRNTSAQGAVQLLMELTGVLEHRKIKALTPYHPKAWEDEFRKAGLSEKYSHIITGLRYGFRIGLPLINNTQSPPNKDSVVEFAVEFNRIVQNEIQKGRYLGPISRRNMETLIGPFQSSPFSIIPKLGRVDKYRNIQNYSFPSSTSDKFPNSSINSQVDSDLFPTTWGTFAVVALLIHRLPPGSQLATRDVAEAYRTIPLHHSQWLSTVVRVGDDAFAIDTALAFGSGPSAGTYGAVRNAASDILRFQGIGPISSWVDDHLFFRIPCSSLPEYNKKRRTWNADIISRGEHQEGGRIWFGGRRFKDGTLEEFDEDCTFPCKDLSASSDRPAEDRSYAYNFDDIDAASRLLWIPWEVSKDRPFASSTTYISFDWNIETNRVSLADSKKEKYLAATENWFSQTSHTLEEVEKLYGKLLHACLVRPSGRAYLTELERMLGLFHDSPLVPRSSPRELRKDLEWWVNELRQPILSTTIPQPVSLYDTDAFSDASSEFGIAITIGDKWRAWRLIPGWKTLDGQRDIGWAEAIAFECLVRYLANTHSEKQHFLVHGDNRGVVEGWWNGRSRSRPINEVFKRLHEFSRVSAVGSSFHTVYVGSKFNPADAPSRGIYLPESLLLPPTQLPPELNRFIIDSQSPFTAIELRERREKSIHRATKGQRDNAHPRFDHRA